MAPKWNRRIFSEKGGLKGGQPQRSDERLFMQLLAFTGCTDAAAAGAHLQPHRCQESSTKISTIRGHRASECLGRPDLFVDLVRPACTSGVFASYTLKPNYTMFGRTYSPGYEPDWRMPSSAGRDGRSSIRIGVGPWDPLRRSGAFARLPADQQRTILAEHGAIGKSFGAADYAHDVRLACHGLDRDDNDFVIGLIGRELFPLSAVVQSMRKTQQTALYLDRWALLRGPRRVAL